MSQIYFKLLSSDRTSRDTFKGVKWGLKKWQVAAPGPSTFQFYTSPELAVFLDPIHKEYGKESLLFTCEVDDSLPVKHDGLQGSCKRMRILKRHPLPTMTLKQRVYAAIFIAKRTLKKGTIPVWDTWAKEYLAGNHPTDAIWDKAWDKVNAVAEKAMAAAYTEDSREYAIAKNPTRTTWDTPWARIIQVGAAGAASVAMVAKEKESNFNPWRFADQLTECVRKGLQNEPQTKKRRP